MERWMDCDCGYGMMFDPHWQQPDCPHCGHDDGWKVVEVKT